MLNKINFVLLNDLSPTSLSLEVEHLNEYFVGHRLESLTYTQDFL